MTYFLFFVKFRSCCTTIIHFNSCCLEGPVFTLCTFALYISYTFTSSEVQVQMTLWSYSFNFMCNHPKMQGIVSFSKSRSECISSRCIQFICSHCFLASVCVFASSLAGSLAQLPGCTWMMLFLGSVASLFMFGCHLVLLLLCVADLRESADRPPRNEGIAIVQSQTSRNCIDTGLCI